MVVYYQGDWYRDAEGRVFEYVYDIDQNIMRWDEICSECAEKLSATKERTPPTDGESSCGGA